MKRVPAVVFLIGLLASEIWTKPDENTSAIQLGVGDLGTNVGGRLGSALGQTVGAGLGSVEQLGAGLLGLGGGLVGGVGSGLVSGLQAGLNPTSPGRGEQSGGEQVGVDLNTGINGQGKVNNGANVYDRDVYPNSLPINTNNAGNGVTNGYRSSVEYGYGGNYGPEDNLHGFSHSQRMQYAGANVYKDHAYPNSYPYYPHNYGLGGNYGGPEYQNAVPNVHHGSYPYNSPYNMYDPRMGVGYGPTHPYAYRPHGYGNYVAGRHYGEGIPYGTNVYADHTYPNYFAPNPNNVRREGGYINSRGFDAGSRGHRLHNAEANIHSNRGSYPSSYPFNSNKAGPGAIFDTNYDSRLEYGDIAAARPGKTQGIRAGDGFVAEEDTRINAGVNPASRSRSKPDQDRKIGIENGYDLRFGTGSSATGGVATNAEIGVGSNVGEIESKSGSQADTDVTNKARPIVGNRDESTGGLGFEAGVGSGFRPSVAVTEAEIEATVDN